MKSLVLLFVLAIAAVSQAYHRASRRDSSYLDPSKAREYFEKFKQDYNKNYANQEEEDMRFERFKQNIDKINKMNQEQPAATFGINKFSDYTPEEEANLNGFKPN